MTQLNVDSRLYVAGHTGRIGDPRQLNTEGSRHILVTTRRQLDLRDHAAVVSLRQVCVSA
jgi:hypothetical protein